MLSFLEEWLPKIADTIWGWGPEFLGGTSLMVILLLGTGLVLTAVTGVVQVRKFGRASSLLMQGALKKDHSEDAEGDITPFQALMTSLSATVGNGNIAGVAGAVGVGGPGAAFWMVVTAVFGMATKYAEAVLGIHYRKVNEDGSMAGGPMYYCEYGIKGRLGKGLGIMFAVCGTLACLVGTGNMFQTNSIATAVARQFEIPQIVTGAIVTILAGMVILGGVKRIARVAEKLVPTMIILYFGFALLIILWNIAGVPEALSLIVRSAFNPQAALGGAVGFGIQQAIQQGVRRGILSNESGLGSAPIAHGAAKTNDPVKQGQIAMMGTFIDTIIVCSLTATVLTVTGVYKMGEAMGGNLRTIQLTTEAFNTGLPGWAMSLLEPFGGGGTIVALASLLFGFSTLLGWCYYGEQCLAYLFGIKSRIIFRLTFIVLMFVGSLPSEEGISVVLKVGDIGNALMAVPNLIGLLVLAGIVSRMTKEAG